jgi:predicted aspartyl protease
MQEGKTIGLEFPQPIQIRALIDTGASLTVVNPEVAQSRKLRHTGFANIVAAGGSGRYPEYAAAVTFPESGLRGFDSIRVVACPIVRQPVSCLIGRDILRYWSMTYLGSKGEVALWD